MNAWQAGGDFLFLSCSHAILVSLCIQYILLSPPISPVHPTHTLSPKPLAVINPSIVTVTAEHASYACLFGVEELITSSQQGPYRQQYMWCACDTMSKIHANAHCYELYCWMIWQHTHYCRRTPYFTWKPPFYTEPCYRQHIQIKRQTWFLLIALHSYIFCLASFHAWNHLGIFSNGASVWM